MHDGMEKPETLPSDLKFHVPSVCIVCLCLLNPSGSQPFYTDERQFDAAHGEDAGPGTTCDLCIQSQYLVGTRGDSLAHEKARRGKLRRMRSKHKNA